MRVMVIDDGYFGDSDNVLCTSDKLSAVVASSRGKVELVCPDRLIDDNVKEVLSDPNIVFIK